MKRILSLLLFLFVLVPFPVHGEEVDQDRDGSLTVTVHDGSQALPGGTLTLLEAGWIENRPEGPTFVFNEAFSGLEMDASRLQERKYINQAVAYAKAHGIHGLTVKVPSSGTVTFQPLKPGLYLVLQETASPGYEAMNPFFISVPQWNAKSQSYSYTVNAWPKSDPARLKTARSAPVQTAAPSSVKTAGRPLQADDSQTGLHQLGTAMVVLSATLFLLEHRSLNH